MTSKNTFQSFCSHLFDLDHFISFRPHHIYLDHFMRSEQDKCSYEPRQGLILSVVPPIYRDFNRVIYS
jgi:hypothetical protein